MNRSTALMSGLVRKHRGRSADVLSRLVVLVPVVGLFGCRWDTVGPINQDVSPFFNLTPTAAVPISDIPGTHPILRDINNTGQAISMQGWLWTEQSGVLHTGLERAQAINEEGWVLGSVDGRPALWTRQDGIRVLFSEHPGSVDVQDINDAGVVIGSVIISGWSRGYRWSSADGFELLALPSGWHSYSPRGINNVGATVGYYYLNTAGSITGPFPCYWSATTGYVTLSIPLGETGLAVDINNAGGIAGKVNGSPAYWPSHLSDPIVAALAGGAQAINDAGILVGTYGTQAPLVPFIWDPGDEPRPLPVPAEFSFGGGAMGLNDMGQVVGYAEGTAYRAMVWTYQVYEFEGFYSPIANLPTLNVVNSGGGIPVTFSLGGDKGLDIFEPGFPASRPYPCDASVETNALISAETAGRSSLSYDATSDAYTYVWKTAKDWQGTCRELVVSLKDGTTHTAVFQFLR